MFDSTSMTSQRPAADPTGSICSRILLVLSFAVLVVLPRPGICQDNTEGGRTYGSQIAKHRLFGPLSDRVDAEVTEIFRYMSNLSPEKARGLVNTFRECSRSGDSRPCVKVLTALGLSQDSIKQDGLQARAIIKGLGLVRMDPQVLIVSFRQAQVLTGGSGTKSKLGRMVTGAVALKCEPECRENLGHFSAQVKGDHLRRMSLSDAGEWVIDFGKTVIDIYDWLCKSVWFCDEEDRSCENDADCDVGDYCNINFENDCRPKLDLGRLCSRGGNCLSGCCKPHYTAAFLPICRPANKCN